MSYLAESFENMMADDGNIKEKANIFTMFQIFFLSAREKDK